MPTLRDQFYSAWNESGLGETPKPETTPASTSGIEDVRSTFYKEWQNAGLEMPEPTPPPKPEAPSLAKRIGLGYMRGSSAVGRSFMALAEGVSEAVGAKGVAETMREAQDVQKAYEADISKQIGGAQSFVQGDQSLYNKAKRGELTAGDVGNAAVDLVSGQLPQLALGAGAGKVIGTAITKAAPILTASKAGQVAAGVAGTTVPMAAQETGSIYAEQAPEEKSLAKAAATGVPAGILEAAGQVYGLAKSGVGGVIAESLAPVGKKTLRKIAADTGKVALSEGAQEASQNVLEQVGQKTGWDIAKDIKGIDPVEVAENAIAGAVLGGGLHGSVAPVTNMLVGSSGTDSKATRPDSQVTPEVKESPAPVVLSPDVETSITDAPTEAQTSFAKKVAGNEIYNSLAEGGVPPEILEADKQLSARVKNLQRRATTGEDVASLVEQAKQFFTDKYADVIAEEKKKVSEAPVVAPESLSPQAPMEGMPTPKITLPTSNLEAAVSQSPAAEQVMPTVQAPEIATAATKTVVPDKPFVMPQEIARIPETQRAPIEAKLPEHLDTTPSWGYKDRTFGLQFENAIDKAAYMATRRKTDLNTRQYIDFVKRETGLDETQVLALGKDIRAGITEMAKTATPGRLELPRFFGETKLAEPSPQRELLDETAAAPIETAPSAILPDMQTVTTVAEKPVVEKGDYEASFTARSNVLDKIAEGYNKLQEFADKNPVVLGSKTYADRANQLFVLADRVNNDQARAAAKFGKAIAASKEYTPTPAMAQEYVKAVEMHKQNAAISQGEQPVSSMLDVVGNNPGMPIRPMTRTLPNGTTVKAAAIPFGKTIDATGAPINSFNHYVFETDNAGNVAVRDAGGVKLTSPAAIKEMATKYKVDVSNVAPENVASEVVRELHNRQVSKSDPAVFERDAETTRESIKQATGNDVDVKPEFLYSVKRAFGDKVYNAIRENIINTEVEKANTKAASEVKGKDTEAINSVFKGVSDVATRHDMSWYFRNLKEKNEAALFQALGKEAQYRVRLFNQLTTDKDATSKYSLATMSGRNNIAPTVDDRFEAKEGNAKVVSYLTETLIEDGIVPESARGYVEENIKTGTFRGSLYQKALSSVADVLGAKLVVISAPKDFGLNGVYTTGQEVNGQSLSKPHIIINANASTGLTKVFAHEMFHHLKGSLSTEQFNQLQIVAAQSMPDAAFQAKLNEYAERWDATSEVAQGDEFWKQEELLADMFAEAVWTPAFWEAAYNENASVAHKAFVRMAEMITKIVEAVKGVFKVGGNFQYDDQTMLDATDELARLFGNIAARGTNTIYDKYTPTRLAAAWHGSPHDFERFITEKIGAGEGSQVYGYGLYFAGNKAVAESYREKLSKGGEGRLYKVDLAPKEEEYLLWDKPLSEQNKVVKDVIAEMEKQFPGEETAMHLTGGDFYEGVSAWLGSDKKASDYLLERGVRGVKYADAWSRAEKEKTYNYVVFSNRDISVTAKYSLSDALKKITSPKPIDQMTPAERLAHGRTVGQVVMDFWKGALDTFKRNFAPYIGASRESVEDAYYQANRPNLTVDTVDGQLHKEYRHHFGKMTNAQWIEIQDSVREGIMRDLIDGNISREDTVSEAFPMGIDDKTVKFFNDIQGQFLDNQFNRLQEVVGGDGINYAKDHFGQMLQWFDPAKQSEPNTLDWLFQNAPRYSKLEGKKAFLRRRSGELPSAKIMQGLRPQSLNPYDVFLGYMKETEKLIAIRSRFETMKNEGRLVYVKGGDKAPEGFTSLQDNALGVYAPHFIGKDENGENMFATVKLGEWFVKKDYAMMMHNHLSTDYIRRNKVGRAALAAKNTYTAIELGLSAFHAFTIANEYLSALQAWGYQQGRLKGNRLGETAKASVLGQILSLATNKVNAVSRVREINKAREALMSAKPEERMAMLKDPAFNARMSKYVGNDVDFMQMINMYYKAGGSARQDAGLKMMEGHVDYSSLKSFTESITDYANKALADASGPLGKAKAQFNIARFALIKATSDILFEKMIPQIKFATFAMEYAQQLQIQRESLELGLTTRSEVARQQVNFNEQRFGEMNWNNMWLNRNIKTVLQIFFRSFTWKYGTYAALAGGVKDIGKFGLEVGQKALGKKEGTVNMGQNGVWLVSAMATHMMLAAMIQAIAGQGYNDPADKDVSLLTKLMYPKTGSNRFSAIPSYLTEMDKIVKHIVHLEPAKLWTGSVNGLMGKVADLWNNVTPDSRFISNPADNFAKRMLDKALYMLPAPISIKGMTKTIQEGEGATSLLPLFGVMKAPAAVTQDKATRLANEMRATEYNRKPQASDVADINSKWKKLSYQIEKGIRDKDGRYPALVELRREGQFTEDRFKKALERVEFIEGKKNPMFVPTLDRRIKELDIPDVIRLWGAMDDEQKKRYRQTIIQKINRSNLTGKVPPKTVKERMNAAVEAGIIKR